MFYKTLVLAALAPGMMLTGYSLSDRFDDLERGQGLLGLFRQDISDDMRNQIHHVYSVMDSERTKWKLIGFPAQENNYYQLKFVPADDNSYRNNLTFEVFFNSPKANLQQKWEEIKTNLETDGYSLEIVNQTHDSIEYFFKKEGRLGASNNQIIGIHFNVTGLIKEFENNLVWSFEYVDQNDNLEKKDAQEIIEKMKKIQEKFLNE